MTARSDDSHLAALLGWLLRPAPRMWTLTVLALAVALGVALGLVLGRVIHDERSSCAIQSRGLRAGHYQAAVIGDLERLITLPAITRAQRLAKANESPAAVKILNDLAGNASAYYALEAKQPKTRTC